MSEGGHDDARLGNGGMDESKQHLLRMLWKDNAFKKMSSPHEAVQYLEGDENLAEAFNAIVTNRTSQKAGRKTAAEKKSVAVSGLEPEEITKIKTAFELWQEILNGDKPGSSPSRSHHGRAQETRIMSATEQEVGHAVRRWSKELLNSNNTAEQNLGKEWLYQQIIDEMTATKIITEWQDPTPPNDGHGGIGPEAALFKLIAENDHARNAPSGPYVTEGAMGSPHFNQDNDTTLFERGTLSYRELYRLAHFHHYDCAPLLPSGELVIGPDGVNRVGPYWRHFFG